MTQSPTVSIVMAAYNRADVMRFAIASALRSTYRDFELIVVGDGCTDHSAEVVAEFGDERVTFSNLPENTGGQAAPNNFGIERARGEFVLFLNQDDLYLEHHIERTVSALERTGALVTWCPVVLMRQLGRMSGPPDFDTDSISLMGAVGPSGYDSRCFYLASSWGVRRCAFDIVGPWHAEDESRVTPSQNWLFRAFRAGLPMHYRRDPTVVGIHAGSRRSSYLKASWEHERVWSWLTGGSALVTQMLAVAASTIASDLYAVERAMRDTDDRLIDELASRFAIHRDELGRFLEGEAAGDFIRQVQRYTTEVVQLELGKVARVGEVGFDGMFGSGWDLGEGEHRWSRTENAEILLATDRPARWCELTMSPVRPGSKVRVAINSVKVVKTELGERQSISIEVGELPSPYHVMISVDECASPLELGLGVDGRRLGVALHELCMR